MRNASMVINVDCCKVQWYSLAYGPTIEGNEERAGISHVKKESASLRVLPIELDVP